MDAKAGHRGLGRLVASQVTTWIFRRSLNERGDLGLTYYASRGRWPMPHITGHS